jgi:L-arabinose isomerase
MRKPLVGLLPLYIELYDRSSPEVRPDIDTFHRRVSEKLRGIGLDVVDVPVCRLAEEFNDAITNFERHHVDAIVTLHLAYSPSLESEKALRNTKIPIIVLDTTPDYTYDQYTDISALILNHGIHGVQDMCNLLLRNNKFFTICAGHLEHSGVLSRIFSAAKAAMIVGALRKARVGLVGEPFAGMGDFRIPFDEMENDLGITTVPYDFKQGEKHIAAITQEDIRAEYKRDTERFNIDKNLTREVYDRSVRVSLAIREWVKDEKLTAFTINFNEACCENPGLPIMPFTECSTAMAEGIGYAGEGDVLTAAFTGALLSVYKETSFTEMFCPDWEHGSLFMSHMGEYNYNIADGKPFLMEKPFPFTSAENPTVAYSTMKGGRVTLINLAPFGQGRYGLTIVPGEMLVIKGENRMALSVNGWFKPVMELPDFLEKYSKCGATHHSVLVYGDVIEEVKLVAEFLGIHSDVLK